MEKRDGVFIVIEGSDGSGKATQAKLIKDRLEAAGYTVETFDFPRYDQPSSYFVKRYLDGAYGQSYEVGPYTSSLFYALDRFEAAPQIREALQQGKIVISNRYTGSNMAHQGTKIGNAEQRRGFFIWLDNLEFEMLRIPRPDISFVLRVPVEISQKLMEGRTKDIHESDPDHLARTLTVYDDMTQLFPKDFQRVDCVRGSQLLDIETINTMLWEKINPLLPPVAPSAKAPAVAKAKTEERPAATETAKETVKEVAAIGPKVLVVENASGLLGQKIEAVAKTARLDHPDIPSIYVPAGLIPDARKEYDSKASAILGLYAKLVAGLAKHGISAAEARQNAQQVLPVAATARVSVDVNDPDLEELIISLLSDELPEAQAAGASLMAQAINFQPDRFRGVEQPIKRTARAAVKALAEEFLAENLIGDQPAVQLTAVWPRNEADLVADMLYEHSNLSLRTIQDRIATWPLNRKLAVFEAYLSDGQPGTALEKAHYSWDLLTPYSTFRELLRTPAEALQTQSLTPRYGFDTPKLIEETDLSDTYEKCFELSLELYSSLQKAGHQRDAQYAVLYGHSQRWKMTQNAAQAVLLLLQKSTNPDTQKLLLKMSEKLAEVHPILGELSSGK